MPWVEGDGLTPTNLNTKGASATSVAGFSTNTLTPESGTSILLQGALLLTTASRFTSGTASAPGLVPESEVSLGVFRSAASHLALSYGTWVASGSSVTNLRGSTASFSGEIATGTGVVLRQGAYVDYKTGGTDLWMVAPNLGAYGADQLIVQDRQNLNTGMLVVQQGAGFSIGQPAQHQRSATSGFIYVSSTTDAPTGTPNAMTGKIPLFYDTGNNALWAYNGSWRSATFV